MLTQGRCRQHHFHQTDDYACPEQPICAGALAEHQARVAISSIAGVLSDDGPVQNEDVQEDHDDRVDDIDGLVIHTLGDVDCELIGDSLFCTACGGSG